MAGEYLVINPRRKSRRRTSTRRRKRSTGTRRRRRNPMYALNKRRRRRNPRALFGGGGRQFKLFGLDVGAAAWIAGGLVGTNWLTGVVQPMIPMQFMQTRPGSIVLKLGITTALATMGGALLGKKAAALVAIGGGASIVLDVYGMAAEQFPALPQMSGYNEMLGEYVPETSALGEGAGGPSYEFGQTPAPNRGMWSPNWAASEA